MVKRTKKKKYIEYRKINTRIVRAKNGNFGDHKFIGNLLGEFRITHGPGYRIYFGLYKDAVVLLLQGGTKKTQPEDIKLSKKRWSKYLRQQEETNNEK